MALSNEALEQRIVELTKKLETVLDGRLDTHPPVGTVILLAGTTPPSGYMLCDGRSISRERFAGLFALIGVSWGSGDGATTFNIPDLRGHFLRVHNPRVSTGVDKAREIGVSQEGRTRLPHRSFRLSISNQEGHSHIVSDSGRHTHAISSSGRHHHMMANAGSHSHEADNAGLHNHDSRVRARFNGDEIENWDFAAKIARVDNPVMRVTGEAGQHTHDITINGDHVHTIAPSGHHTHAAASAPNHRHDIGVDGAHSHSATISGGDAETRPINHALAAFIRTEV